MSNDTSFAASWSILGGSIGDLSEHLELDSFFLGVPEQLRFFFFVSLLICMSNIPLCIFGGGGKVSWLFVF